ncbi:MAG: ABC transporter substrate-binding protein [Pseudomonadota bacterium]
MQRLNLYLDWKLNCQFAGLIWALDMGLFERGGVDLRVIQPVAGDPVPVLDRVQLNADAIGTVEENLAIQAAAEGRPVRAFGAMLQRAPLVLMTDAAGPVRGFADLSGRRVAMHADGATQLRALMRLSGLDPDEIDMTVGGWTLADLRQGRFDAVQGYAITEAQALARAGYDARLIPLHHAALSPASIVLVAHQDLADRRTDVLRAVLDALAVGWAAVLQDPASAAQTVALWSEEHPDAVQNEAILRGMSEYVRRGPNAPLVRLSRARLEQNIRSLGRARALAQPLDVADVLVPGLAV